LIFKHLASLDAMCGGTVAAMLLVNDPGDWGHVYWPLLLAGVLSLLLGALRSLWLPLNKNLWTPRSCCGVPAGPHWCCWHSMD
jgi:predicted acyltransferase